MKGKAAFGICDVAIFFNEETALGAYKAAVLNSDETFVAGEEEAAFALLMKKFLSFSILIEQELILVLMNEGQLVTVKNLALTRDISCYF